MYMDVLISRVQLECYGEQVYTTLGNEKMSPREALKDGTDDTEFEWKNIMSSGTLEFFNTFSAKLCNTINGRYGVVL